MENAFLIDKRFGDIQDIMDFLFITQGVREIAKKEINEVIQNVLDVRYPLCHDQPTDTHSFSAFLSLSFPVGIYKKTYHQLLDFWQFPHETLLLGYGDCEDTSILLGSLARARGMDYWVVVGAVYYDTELLGYHAWVHLNIEGSWYLIESTLDESPESWPKLDSATPKQVEYKGLTYEPLILFNHEEVNQVGEFQISEKKIKWDKRKLRKLKEEW